MVSLAAGSGFIYVVWNTTQPAEPTVVLRVEKLIELATVKQTVQVTVTEEETRAALRSLGCVSECGEKLHRVAVGEIEAGVDLDELGEEDVRVVGNTVTRRPHTGS